MAGKISKLTYTFFGIGFMAGLAVGAVIFNMTRDKTIAVVDGTSIKQSELYRVLKSQNGAGALQRLIDNIIVKKTAGKYGISISDQELETELSNKINLEYHSKEAFRQSLTALNMTMSEAREELRLAMLFDRIATRDIQVSEDEIRRYYQNHPLEFVKPEMRRVREIVLKTDDEAQNVRKELLSGADFAALAGMKSTGLDRDKGGDRGFIVKGALNQVAPDVETMAFSLGQGEISPVIKAPDGFHIVRVEQIIPQSQLKYEDQKQAAVLKAKLAKCRPFEQILNQLRKESTIRIFENFNRAE